jgi:hypothetical protein
VLLADVYIELRDAERDAALLPALDSYGDTVVVLWPGVTILGPAALYRGEALALLNRAEARAELERAVQLADLFSMAPFAARARTALAAVA